MHIAASRGETLARRSTSLYSVHPIDSEGKIFARPYYSRVTLEQLSLSSLIGCTFLLFRAYSIVEDGWGDDAVYAQTGCMFLERPPFLIQRENVSL